MRLVPKSEGIIGVALLLALLLVMVAAAGCGGGAGAGGPSGDGGGGPGSGSDGGLCPPGPPITGGPDNCGGCPGVACASTDSCNSSFHASGGLHTDVCACIDGHFGCCQWNVGGPSPDPRCDYGPGGRSPSCPAAEPQSGDPCGTIVACAYVDPCCSGQVTAACIGGAWTIIH